MTDTTDDREEPEGPDEPDVLGAAHTLDVVTRKERRRERRAHQRRPTSPPPQPGQSVRSVDDEPDGSSGIVDVFEPHRAVTPRVRPYLTSLWHRREFLVELARSQLRGTRSNTALGGIWGVLDPLFQAAIYFFLFTTIRGSAGRPPHFLFLLIAGILLFQLSVAALAEGGNSIRQSSNLMLNSTFPRALLPLASVYKGVLKIIPALVVIAATQIVVGAPYTRHLLWLPLLFGIQIVVAIGMALASATLIVYFRDAGNLMTYVTRLLFFTTPIIYPYTLVEDFDHWLIANPLYPIFVNYQKAFGGEAISYRLLGLSVLWAAVILFVGGRQFLRRERDFARKL